VARQVRRPGRVQGRAQAHVAKFLATNKPAQPNNGAPHDHRRPRDRSAPGIYDIPADEYHRDPCPTPAVSNSAIKRILTHSPRHAFTESRRLNPNHQRKEKWEFDRGSAAHALLLEGEDRMRVLPFEDYRKDAAKHARDDARAAGFYPVLQEQYESILQMRENALAAIAACKDLGGITLLDGKPEQTLIWQEGDTWARARLDWLHRDGILVLDYKTTETCAHPDAWVRTMAGMGGDIQGSFYLRGNKAVGGDPLAKFVFIVQEVTPPFAVCLIGLPPMFLELGTLKVCEGIDLWARCVATNSWPAYPDRICWVEPPPYLMAQWEARSIGADPAPPNEDDPITDASLRSMQRRAA
jgi:hypothetical protein